jgi:hypothetical protein
MYITFALMAICACKSFELIFTDRTCAGFNLFGYKSVFLHSRKDRRANNSYTRGRGVVLVQEGDCSPGRLGVGSCFLTAHEQMRPCERRTKKLRIAIFRHIRFSFCGCASDKISENLPNFILSC